MPDANHERDLYREIELLKEKVSELEKFSDDLSTALLQNQAKTMAVFKALPYMIFELSADGTHLDFYAHNSQQLFVKPNDFIGKKVNDVLPENVATLYLEHIQAALNSGKLQIFDYQLEFPDGTRNYQARLTVGGYSKVLAIVSELGT